MNWLDGIDFNSIREVWTDAYAILAEAHENETATHESLLPLYNWEEDEGLEL